MASMGEGCQVYAHGWKSKELQQKGGVTKDLEYDSHNVELSENETLLLVKYKILKN